MGILGGITRPIGDLAQKTAKAGKIANVKSVKVKVKFDPKAQKPNGKN